MSTGLEMQPDLTVILLRTGISSPKVTMGSRPADFSLFDGVDYVPPDAIFELTKLYNADTSTRRVNLGQGTYKDEHGNPWILPSVREAKEKTRDANHEYLPILGLELFRNLAARRVYGEKSRHVLEDRVSCGSQARQLSISDTSLALHLHRLPRARHCREQEGYIWRDYSWPT